MWNYYLYPILDISRNVNFESESESSEAEMEIMAQRHHLESPINFGRNGCVCMEGMIKTEDSYILVKYNFQ